MNLRAISSITARFLGSIANICSLSSAALVLKLIRDETRNRVLTGDIARTIKILFLGIASSTIYRLLSLTVTIFTSGLLIQCNRSNTHIYHPPTTAFGNDPSNIAKMHVVYIYKPCWIMVNQTWSTVFFSIEIILGILFLSQQHEGWICKTHLMGRLIKTWTFYDPLNIAIIDSPHIRLWNNSFNIKYTMTFFVPNLLREMSL